MILDKWFKQEIEKIKSENKEHSQHTDWIILLFYNLENNFIGILENNPCSAVFCDVGQSCHISSDGVASCKCVEYCAPIMKPICAMV